MNAARKFAGAVFRVTPRKVLQRTGKTSVLQWRRRTQNPSGAREKRNIAVGTP